MSSFVKVTNKSKIYRNKIPKKVKTWENFSLQFSKSKSMNFVLGKK